MIETISALENLPKHMPNLSQLNLPSNVPIPVKGVPLRSVSQPLPKPLNLNSQGDIMPLPNQMTADDIFKDLGVARKDASTADDIFKDLGIVAPKPKEGLLKRAGKFVMEDVLGSVARPMIQPFVSVYRGLTNTKGAVSTPFGKIKPIAEMTSKEALGEAITLLAATAPLTKAAPVGNKIVTSTLGPKAAAWGKQLLPRAVESAAIGTGFSAGSALEENRMPTMGELTLGGAIGAAIPAVGTGLSALSGSGEKIGLKAIDSLIKPLKNQVSYGKNPARGLINEMIEQKATPSSLNELLSFTEKGLESNSAKLAQELEGAGVKQLDLSGVLSPIDEKISQLQKTPRSNEAAIKRLQDARDDLLGKVVDENGNISYSRDLSKVNPVEATDFKRLVGDITKFTGNDSDDKAVNIALKSVYGKTMDAIEKAVPSASKLNERIADLIGAKKAIENRITVSERQNLFPMFSKIGGAGAAIVESMVTGGIPIYSLLGMGAATLADKIAGSTPVKLRIGKWLAGSTLAERKAIYAEIPALKNALERVFGITDAVNPDIKKVQSKMPLAPKKAEGIKLPERSPVLLQSR